MLTAFRAFAARMRTIRRHIEISDDRRPELLAGNPIRYALNPAQKEHGIRLQSAYHNAVHDTIADDRHTTLVFTLLGVQSGLPSSHAQLTFSREP